MEERKRRWKAVIIILSVLLVLSLAALAATLIYSYLSETQPVTVMVPDNIITPDPANPQETPASAEGRKRRNRRLFLTDGGSGEHGPRGLREHGVKGGRGPVISCTTKRGR